MLRLLRRLLPAALAPLPLIAAAPATAPAAYAAGCGTWTQVPAHDPGGFSMLTGLAIESPTDIWTIGGGGFQHDTGGGFNLVAAPSLGTLRGGTQAISADASNDVWAVGHSAPARSYPPTSTLVEHFDGSSWKVVPSPSPDAQQNTLVGVLALAPNDVWAVGQSARRALIEHFDGSSWTVTAAPAPGTTSALSAIAGAGQSDVKAVGWFADAAGSHPLVVSFHGAGWTADPGLPAAPATLNALAHVPGTNHYVAVGSSTADPLLAFDGARWSSRPGAGAPFAQQPGSIGSVDAVSDTDVWLAGSYQGSADALWATQPFALQSSGTGWTSRFATFSVGQEGSLLATVGHAGGTMFVVGYDNPTTTSYGDVFAATMAC